MAPEVDLLSFIHSLRSLDIGSDSGEVVVNISLVWSPTEGRVSQSKSVLGWLRLFRVERAGFDIVDGGYCDGNAKLERKWLGI